MSNVLEIVLRSLEYGSIYAFAALSIILIYKTSFTANFAQGALGMFNTYVVAYVFSKMGFHLYLSIVAGVCTALIIGFLVDMGIFRYAKNLSAVGKQIITLGIMSIILGLTPLVFGVYDMPLPKIIPQGSLSILGASISKNAVFNIIFGLIIMLSLFFILLNTKMGLGIRATASNENTAKLMGIPTKTVTMIAWGIAGVLSLFSGIMAAPFSAVSPFFLNDVQLNAFMACVLGGFQTFYGAVIASYIIAVLSNLLQIYLPYGTIWGKPILYLLILLFLLFKPLGLFGKKHTKKV